MIKLGQHLRISPFAILLFIICVFTQQHKIFFITYFTIFLHEIAHLAAAEFLGLKIDNITLHPFGVNLQLKNKIVYSVYDEIILYAAGPAFNILCALVLNLTGCKTDIMKYFYICNIVLFFINILPVLPLDGGIILKKIIAHFCGYKVAQICLTITSVAIILALSAIEIISAYQSGINYSVMLMIIFLIGNIFTQNEKYDIDFVNELMFYNNKRQHKAKLLVMQDNTDYREIAKKFTKDRYGIVLHINPNGEIEEILTEKQIIDHIME